MFFRRRPTISLLIPFSSKDPIRRRNFKWLLKYWAVQLPEAEIIIGHSTSKPFCKSEAINKAAEKAHGNILVVLDADALFSPHIIRSCATSIIEEKILGHNLWYIPYRHLWRLNQETTEQVISNSPSDYDFLGDEVPFPYQIEGDGTQAKYGHRFAAMIMMFPREAFEAIGGFDERFKGWGGEDVAHMRAIDTLWGKHKTVNANIYHLWHPTFGDSYRTRMWAGQSAPNSNSKLAMAYHKASRKPSEMRELVTKKK